MELSREEIEEFRSRSNPTREELALVREHYLRYFPWLSLLSSKKLACFVRVTKNVGEALWLNTPARLAYDRIMQHLLVTRACAVLPPMSAQAVSERPQVFFLVPEAVSRVNDPPLPFEGYSNIDEISLQLQAVQLALHTAGLVVNPLAAAALVGTGMHAEEELGRQVFAALLQSFFRHVNIEPNLDATVLRVTDTTSPEELVQRLAEAIYGRDGMLASVTEVSFFIRGGAPSRKPGLHPLWESSPAVPEGCVVALGGRSASEEVVSSLVIVPAEDFIRISDAGILQVGHYWAAAHPVPVPLARLVPAE